MPYVTPPTFVASTVATADDINILGSDIAYLYGVQQGIVASVVQVRRAANQSISDNTKTNVSFDSETVDIGGWYSSGANITVPAGAIPSGYTSIGVLLLAQCQFASNSTGRRWLYVTKNGTDTGSWNTSAQNGDTTDITFPDYTTCEAGDVFNLAVKQTSGGSINLAEGRLTIIRLHPYA